MRFIKRQQQYFLIGLVFVILGFLGKIIYRPFIYANNIPDLGIADSLPGFFYVIGFAFMLSIIQIKKTDIIIAIVTLASIVYEFISSGRIRLLTFQMLFTQYMEVS